MMKKWFLILITCTAMLAGVMSVHAQNASDTFLCDNTDDLTGGSIQVTGGFDNVYDASRNLTGSTFCRVLVLDSQVRTQIAEVGNQEAISRGVFQAVDVVGMFPEGETVNTFRTAVRVCLRGDGDIQFLDATDSTRTIRTVPEVENDGLDGFICADISGAGTVLLTPAGPALGTTSTFTNAFVPPSAISSADPNAVVELNNCEVTTKVKGVFIRRGPGTENRIRWQLENNQTLTATGIAGQWYRVDFRGTPGWIAAAFVYPMGNCLSPEGQVVGTDDLYAPGDATTYYGLTNCQITTNFNGVNLRREPSVRASIRWTFEDSQTLDAVGVSGNWFLIAFRGSPGWIHTEYVNEVGDCTQPGQ
jgi:SH3-like domain-containing protein